MSIHMQDLAHIERNFVLTEEDYDRMICDLNSVVDGYICAIDAYDHAIDDEKFSTDSYLIWLSVEDDASSRGFRFRAHIHFCVSDEYFEKRRQIQKNPVDAFFIVFNQCVFMQHVDAAILMIDEVKNLPIKMTKSRFVDFLMSSEFQNMIRRKKLYDDMLAHQKQRLLQQACDVI